MDGHKRKNHQDPPVPQARNNRNWRNPRRNQNLGSRGNPRRQNINFNNNQKCGDDRNINKNKNIPYFHFTRMNQLNLMSNEDIMGILSQRETDFRDFLSTEMRPDVVVLTVRVLLKVCEANFTELVTRILSKACSTNFLKILEHFLMKLTLESDRDMIDNQLYHQNENGFWSELLEFFKKVNDFIPRTACDKLVPLLQKIEKIIPMIELNQNYKISDDIKTKFSGILKDMEENIETMRQKDVANKLGVTDVDVGEPPDDFRNLSVIPTMEDLFDDKPFLRKCIVEKAYDSVEHYLDVQFRLLREDFVSPLRSGIQEFLVGDKKYKNSDFRIYKNVKLIAFENKENDVGVQLFFGNIKNVDWRRSKRLMFGSLLLLSRNNFESVLFATVLNRENKDLERGYVTIMPCTESIITPDMYNSVFVLLESKIYFEPYLEVLTAMKNINSDNFPMEPYFVKAQIDTQLPRYLRGVSMQTFKNSILLPVGRQNVEWPSASALGMNESQRRAFRSALTEEFAMIQGPPGTGKTFLALEIVRALLENKDYWKKYGPIVVVCLTNHALDQFLEGILHQRCTQSILRVGSRSKSEVLKPYTLMERRRMVAKKSVSNALFYKTKGELRDILQKIQNLRLHIKYLKTPNVLVPIECLSSCGDEALLNTFKNSTHFHSWLMEIDVSQFLPKSANKQSDKDFEYAFDIKDEEDEEVDENKYTDADLLHDFSNLNVDSHKTVSPLDILDEQLQGINECLQKVRRDKNVTIARDALQKLEDDRFTIMERRASICQELKRHPITNQLAGRSPNPRWDQYWRWVKASYEKTSETLFQLEADHRKKDAELQEIKQLLDTEVMKEHEIVGLTTTLAARLQSSLRTLRAPIVLVEEAAEILEAHVVCSITKHCQHVILIGDHKQLRPKASVYELGVKYNLNVSLFERMVNIRGECLQLAYQHRMRPEISKLITPSIYAKLYDHRSVGCYPDVKGVEKNVFFLNHSWPEESHNNEESWKNEHEVKFFLAFAKYLLFQGYQPSEITILCTYTGQLFTFMREVKNHALAKQIRITTVDNYQGEENKIILLSLVRNNGAGNVGFLKEENRVCVALSRAKYGLYVMGNMRDLVVKNNIWPKIKKVLEEDDAIGDSFKLRCQLHTGERVEVKSADDFQKCPEGGCSKKCDLLLQCGHYCKSVCHILDREHANYRCRENCVKRCSAFRYRHPCPLQCWQECQPCQVKESQLLKCGHVVEIPCSVDPKIYLCPVDVEITFPECKHKFTKPCHLSIDLCKCTHGCEIRLSCGHSCVGICHARSDPDHLEYQCTKNCVKKNIDCTQNHTCRKRCYEKCEPCNVPVSKKRSCGHFYPRIECCTIVENLFCERPCQRMLPCDHKCKLPCSEECGNCSEKVKKKSPCGHVVTVKCCEEATPGKCKEKCPKILPCGHKCVKKCKDPCTTKCEALVKLREPGLCGHVSSVPCYLRNTFSKSEALLKYCTEPCGIQLACEHKCSGTCGSCLQGRFHSPCEEPCRNVFICGHRCEILCNKECQPCTKKCQLECRHSKCNKKCGEPCVPCQQPCDRKCEHQKCTKACHELCDIEPCNEICTKMLACKHACVGFCGEPCPPLCRICDKEELTETFFGNEEDEGARFVLLPECKHCIESEGLLRWIQVSTEPDEAVEIKTPTCPKCKTPITNCTRIMNQIKRNLMDLAAVKEKNFSNNSNDLITKQKKCLETINTIKNKNILEVFPVLKNYCKKLRELGSTVRNKRKQNLSYIEINVIVNIIDIIAELTSVLESLRINSNATYEFINKQILLLTESLPLKLQMSKQRLEDVQLELRRLHLMVQIYNLYSEYGIVLTKENNYKILFNHSDMDLMMNKLCISRRFTPLLEKEITGLCNSLSRTSITIEREMIVKAIGLSKGHWFKCPNGHFYAIGECGGAMQRGRCIECGATVGGGQHRIVRGNALATEIDGATAPAWPGPMH